MKKKKILIPYASYGNGHKAIAEYIKNYFESTGNYECMTIDLIKYSLPILGTFTKLSSEVLMTKFTFIWSLLYYSFDNKISTYLSSNLQLKIFDNKKLRNEILSFNPDITISTHFWGSDLINKYNKKRLINSKLITVVTDYRAHEYWLKSLRGTDAIIVSSLDEKRKLLKKGLNKKQVFSTGIPILPSISNNLDKELIKKKLKINNNKKTVLFFAGGSNGTSFNLIYLKEILKHNYDCNLLFIAGRNKNAEKIAKELVKKYNSSNVYVFGFVTNVNELYYISDFVISKPGGAQITECLFFECPMLLIKSNGGQEIENRRYLVKKGYAKSIYNKFTFNKNFKALLLNDKLREKMKKNISKIEQNKAMEKLYKIVEKL